MAFKCYALLLILYVIRSNGRMVRDLLDDEVCASATIFVWPVAIEKPASRSVELVCTRPKTKCIGHVLAKNGIQRPLASGL